MPSEQTTNSSGEDRESWRSAPALLPPRTGYLQSASVLLAQGRCPAECGAGRKSKEGRSRVLSEKEIGIGSLNLPVSCPASWHCLLHLVLASGVNSSYFWKNKSKSPPAFLHDKEIFFSFITKVSSTQPKNWDYSLVFPIVGITVKFHLLTRTGC